MTDEDKQGFIPIYTMAPLPKNLHTQNAIPAHGLDIRACAKDRLIMTILDRIEDIDAQLILLKSSLQDYIFGHDPEDPPGENIPPCKL